MEQDQKLQIRKVTIYWLVLICIIIFRSLANTLELGSSISIIASQVINMMVLLYGAYFLISVIKMNYRVYKKNILTIVVFCWYMVSLVLSDYYVSGELIQLNIYMLIFVIGVVLNNTLEYYDYTKYLNWISGLFVYLSLIVYFLGYGMYGAGRDDARFMGIDTHPSYCGFIISTYMVLNFRKNKIRQVVPVFLMIITMAKTAIGSVILCFGIYLLHEIKRSKWRQLYRVKGIIIVGILYGIFLSLQDSFDWTFTGRTSVWKYSMDAFIDGKSYILGIGTSYMSDWVGQSHNQFIQSLVSNGIFGLLAIIVLMIILFKKTWNMLKYYDCYEPFFVWILLFMRCLTEAPFKLLSIDVVSFPILYLILIPHIDYREEKQ